MKVVWVTRSFLDYRIPVFAEVSRSVGDALALFYNADYVPRRCQAKVQAVLPERAYGLTGELALRCGPQSGFANRGLRIPYQRGLIARILAEKPDVVISDGFFQWTYAALWLRATRHIPHVMCYERTRHTERSAQWFRTVYRRSVMRWIDAICANGRLCGEYTQDLGYPSERITYGHMVADVDGLKQRLASVTETQTTAVRRRHRLGGFVFLYVGQLIPRKGIKELLTAWGRFCAQVEAEKVVLLLVGDGPQRDELEECCRNNAWSNVRFAGAVDYDQLAPYFKCANVFVMPTLEDNWSLVVPEAMACGLPVACSSYNGCWPELVTPQNGWIFDPLDVRDTTAVLGKCYRAEPDLARMGSASQRLVIGGHTAAHAAAGILEACRLALHGTEMN